MYVNELFNHACLAIGAKFRMVKTTRTRKIKSEIKDVLIVAFSTKQTLQPKELHMSSYQTKVYPMTGKPYCVLAYSALLVVLFSGTSFEGMIAGLTWPCTLPPGWSVEWDGPSAGADHPPAE